MKKENTKLKELRVLRELANKYGTKLTGPDKKGRVIYYCCVCGKKVRTTLKSAYDKKLMCDEHIKNNTALEDCSVEKELYFEEKPNKFLDSLKDNKYLFTDITFKTPVDCKIDNDCDCTCESCEKNEQVEEKKESILSKVLRLFNGTHTVKYEFDEKDLISFTKKDGKCRLVIRIK